MMDELQVEVLREFAAFQPGQDFRRGLGFSIIRRTGERGYYSRLGKTPAGGRAARMFVDQHGTEYHGAADASARTGVTISTIYKILLGWCGRKSSKGFTFRYS